MPPPPLVAVSHGTRDPAGRASVSELRTAIARSRPSLQVLEAFADDNVQRPGLAEVLKGRDDAVVVPVLMSSGYHVRVDVGETVNRAGSRVRATRPLGPDPALARV